MVLAHSLAALAALAAVPVGALVLLLRPRWRVGLCERLGMVPRQPPGGVWVHAASVGEALAALRLIDGLRARGHAVFASVTTVAARDLLRRLAPELACRLAPLDHLWCVEAALGRVRPRLLILVETELWPVWIAAAHRRGVPVMVASGRLTERSFARIGRVRRLLAPTLARLACVAARTHEDAERFLALGAAPDRVVVSGDLKQAVSPRDVRLAPELAGVLAGRLAIFVAGSTHAGEEEAALAALAAVRAAGRELALVLAPRDLQRVPRLAGQLRERGLAFRLRSRLRPPEPSADAPLADGEILLLDSLGELRAVDALAQLAFVGGSLVPAGGHNLLEPAQMGCPVVYGPCIANAAEAAALLEKSGAGRRIADAGELAAVLAEVLADPATARARVAAADLAACTQPLEQTLQLAGSLLAGTPGAVGSR